MSDNSGPLDPKTLQILLVLAGRPLHGYAIRQEVEERTDGTIRLWPATLYGALEELTERGLIEETSRPGEEPEDARGRRWYALTASGRVALSAEASRLEELAQLARTRLGLGEAT